MDGYLASVSDACLALGVGRTSIYKLIKNGKLETVTIGRRRLVRTESIRRIAGANDNG